VRGKALQAAQGEVARGAELVVRGLQQARAGTEAVVTTGKGRATDMSARRACWGRRVEGHQVASRCDALVLGVCTWGRGVHMGGGTRCSTGTLRAAANAGQVAAVVTTGGI
jgi:hypothetical protein